MKSISSQNCHMIPVKIPISVTKIGDNAFNNCMNLTEGVIPDSVNEIGVKAFAVCYKLKEVTIPYSVTEIGVEAFALCSGLTNVTFDKDEVSKLISIGEKAFFGCSGLTSVTIQTRSLRLEWKPFPIILLYYLTKTYWKNMHY